MGEQAMLQLWTRSALPICACAVLLAGCDAMGSKAAGVLQNGSCNGDVGIINDQFDAGVSYSFDLINRGETGPLQITVKLSTSEGEWSREQTLEFAPGERRRLTYFFHEPTINATNIACSANIWPEA